MRNIALFLNETKPQAIAIAKEVCSFFQSHSIGMYAPNSIAAHLSIHPLEDGSEKMDFLISIGGDGTILKTAHAYNHLNAPILGINLGYLGFMADVPLYDLNDSLTDLLEGRYEIETRCTLQGKKENGTEEHSAINDFVFHRGKNPSLVEFTLHEDARLINSFKADGIVIATPNGSTAYSLAAGGPILTPDLSAVVITPISPHTISNRPIVVSSKRSIRVACITDAKPIDVVIDGLFSYELPIGTSVTITEGSLPFSLVNLTRRDYFSTLRTKLGWSGKFDPQHY